MKTLIRSAYSPRIRQQTINTEPSMTIQDQKDDTDINNILAKYVKTGLIEHVNKHEGQYGLVSSLDYHTSMTMCKNAESQFEELPSQIRAKFNGNVGDWLEFISDPDNVEDIRDGTLDNEIKSSDEDESLPFNEDEEPPEGGNST